MKTKKFADILTQTSPAGQTAAADLGDFPRSRFKYRSEGLPIEEPETFNIDPISFEEMASSLMEDVMELNSIAVIKNRYSQSYLDLSRQLERGISELASCCITRAAFEQQGIRLQGLDRLRLSLLYALVSGHFRKTHAAVKGTTNKNQQFWVQLLEMEFRWYSLAKRIKATDDRIRLIKSGKLNINKLIEKQEQDRLRTKSADTQKDTGQDDKALPPAKAISFPVMGDFLRDELGKQPESEKEEVPAQTAEPQQYASMKQRKKAERLARKHAREEAAEHGTTDPNQASDTRSAGSPKGDLQKRYEFIRNYLKNIEMDLQVPVGFDAPVPIPIGELQPERV